MTLISRCLQLQSQFYSVGQVEIVSSKILKEKNFLFNINMKECSITIILPFHKALKKEKLPFAFPFDFQRKGDRAHSDLIVTPSLHDLPVSEKELCPTVQYILNDE